MRRNVIIFEDGLVGRLEPIALCRPAYAVTCGGLTLIDLVQAFEVPSQGVVRPHLEDIQQQDFARLGESVNAQDGVLCLNAQLVPHAAALDELGRWISRDTPAAAYQNDRLVAAALPPELGSRAAGLRNTTQLAEFLGPAASGLTKVTAPGELLTYPHDLVRLHEQVTPSNLSWLTQHSPYEEIRAGVYAAGKVQVHEQAVLDTETGPIVLSPGVRVGACAVMKGPISVGHDAVIREHSLITGPVSIGSHCKVGGEIGTSVIESCSNKQHAGFLGHAYLGSWVNLGAGTCNSNLKNTYGNIRMDYEDARVDTGMQFLGCVIGDYSRTAINTSIFTGKLIGVCSNIYGTVTQNVPSFANYAASFGQVTAHPPAVVTTTQRRVLARRGRTQRDCDAQLIRDLYELVGRRANLADEPLSL